MAVVVFTQQETLPALSKCAGMAVSCGLVLASTLQGFRAESQREVHNHLLQTAGKALIADKGNSFLAPDSSSSKKARFRLDGSKSLITARVFVGGLLAAFGHAHTVSVGGLQGEVRMTPDSILPATIQMNMDAKTAQEVGKEFSDKDRQKINHSILTEALQSVQYPDMSFKSTNISITRADDNHFRAKITGDLTLHGMTRSIEVPADVALAGQRLTAHGAFKILHSDFAIRQLSAVAGAVKAKNEIEITYKLVATAD